MSSVFWFLLFCCCGRSFPHFVWFAALRLFLSCAFLLTWVPASVTTAGPRQKVVLGLQEEERCVHTKVQPNLGNRGGVRGEAPASLFGWTHPQAGILNFGSSTSRVLGYKHAYQHQVCVVLGLEPRAWCMLGERSTHWTTLWLLLYLFIFSPAAFSWKLSPEYESRKHFLKASKLMWNVTALCSLDRWRAL